MQPVNIVNEVSVVNSVAKCTGGQHTKPSGEFCEIFGELTNKLG